MPAGRVVQPAVAGAALLPHAAARTASTVRDLSDSGLIVRLTRGRGWIGLLCALLGGIVALNVISLSLNAGAGRVGQQIDLLQTENSALRAQIDERLSASRVEAAASALGLAVPRPKDITYLDASDGDAVRLRDLLENNTFLSTPSVVSSYPTSSTTTESSASSYSTAAPPTASPAPASGTSSGSTGTTGGVGL